MSKRIPLPAYVSGVRCRPFGTTMEAIAINGADGRTYAYVSCGHDAHLAALADAKKMVEGLNGHEIGHEAAPVTQSPPVSETNPSPFMSAI